MDFLTAQGKRRPPRPRGTLRQLGDSALWETCEETFKETYPLTPRGGFFDGRNQNRDPEPSAKPLRHSDKPTNLEMLFLRTGSTTIGEEKSGHSREF